MKHWWGPLRDELAKINLSEYRTGPSRQILVPKSKTGYRAAVQLHPLDALTYAALAYESARKIEKFRIPIRRAIACSFRLRVGADGSLFEKQTGWPTYHARSVKLAKSGKFSCVLVADISDFYNQIYHHRVCNVLQSAGVTADRAKNIEAFLSKLTAKQSRGLPVGPSASIVLSEALLDDVDKFLISSDLTYTRYVDDFRIFCKSDRAAIEAAHGLAEYLYTAHRLALTPSKTRLYSVKKFIESELLDPEEEEERGRVSKLNSLIDNFIRTTGYAIEPEDLDEPDLVKVTRENLRDLFEDAIEKTPLQLGLLRYLLRRAKQIKTGILQKLAVENLTKLAPAMKEVIDYLSGTAKAKQAEEIASALLAHLKDSSVGGIPFVRMWVLEFFTRQPFPKLHKKAMKMAEENLEVRPAALIARANYQVQWVRGQKEKWANHAPWDRRAIIWAGSILPEDERKHWCGLVRDNSADLLDRAVAIRAAEG